MKIIKNPLFWSGTKNQVSSQFEVTIFWSSPEPLLPGRKYIFETNTQTVMATVTCIKYLLQPPSLEHLAAKQIPENAIARCNPSLKQMVAFEPFETNRLTGSFILRDRLSHSLCGTGVLHFALWRSQNIHHQQLDIDQSARAILKNQIPKVLWFTGLSGSGKSTIANQLEKKITPRGKAYLFIRWGQYSS